MPFLVDSADGASFVLARVADLLMPVAGIASLVLISLFDPLLAMLLWVAVAPYSPFIPFDISLGSGIPDLSLTRVMAGFLLLLLLAQAARGRRALRPLTWADLAFGLFALAMLLTAYQSRFGGVLAYQAIFDAYLIPWVVLYLARQLIRGERDLRWVTAVLLVVGVGLAFLIIREQLTGEVLFHNRESARYSESFRKVLSLMGNAAPMGVTAALTLPMGVVLAVRTMTSSPLPRGKRLAGVVLLVLATGFIALGVFMTYNRASWLGILFALLVPALLRPRARRLLLPLLVIAAVAVIIFWQVVVDSPAVTERLLEDNSIGYRTTAAALALDIAQNNLLLGIGYGNFGFAVYETYGWDPYPAINALAPAHNSYLFILVSAGLAALVPYLTWLGLIAWGGVRRYLSPALDTGGQGFVRDALAGGAGVLLTYVVASGTFDNAQAPLMNLVFCLAIGAVWGATEDTGASWREAHGIG